MSAENVAVVHKLVEAFNTRDFEAFAALLAPDAELYPLRAQLERKTYRGPAGVRELFADFDEDWEYVQIAADEIRDAGDQVVILCHLRARGRSSAVDLDVPMAFVLKFRDNLVVYSRSFSEQSDAFREAGIE